MNTYLGPKGYTILKSEIPLKQQLQIKDQLMVRPYTPGAPINIVRTFPVYRESENKLYIPRFFGEELFGSPKKIKISEGLPINLTFNGTLRDYQEPVIRKLINHYKSNSETGACALLELFCAWGKTGGALYTICEIGKKTLFIVHKEFLMNQCIERIKQFIPNARIGKIQGDIIDIENKDIVMCMLQSLISRDYPPEIFSSFGLTIIDEVHHISSESFSNALFKVVTKYMLGLSATMDRKDGTTPIFKMFLGDVLHKAERKNTTIEVEIRGLKYISNDEEYNETTLDFQGKPQISTMISKICQFSPRTEFIIDVLTDFIRKKEISKEEYLENKRIMNENIIPCEICNRNNNYLVKNTCCDCVKYCLICMDNIKPYEHILIDKHGNQKKVKEKPRCPNCRKVLKYEQNYIEDSTIKPLEHLQTIILAHNLNILEYIYNRFVCKNISSVGYYVGGMKERELKITETKQVILATYSMASEGLDIPSLNAEFLITPKTDVIQTIGRVLRAKHPISDPVIYDIYDAHDVFTRQWNKRKQYYKKQGYKIMEMTSKRYLQNHENWTLTCPSKCISTTDKLDIKENKNKKSSSKSNSLKSTSSSEKSFTNDTDEELEFDEEQEEEEQKVEYKCLLKIKK
jgi:superfamily II DNA or RNA helicase